VAAEGIIEPRALYGYYPCAAAGDTLVIFDPDDPARELARFPFPRQPDGGRLCIADYFRPRPAGSEDAADRDVIAFQVVTAGARVADRFAELNARGEYARAYYLHGLAQSTAEALAEYVNRLVRRELGLAGERGRRYSWGYLACPDLEQQETLFRFFPAERIGVRLTTGYQLDPEASTAAFVVHHPEAVYFSARPPQETRGPAAARAQR
jgi:5-methyltetrahydrofolate--homocysteine methyltransferase